ncbi:MAG: extradiol dioxygenase [Bacteroidetes bacterium]|jgi:uncharacterized protein|nr:MAG: extradiol dioxygenase [Bacteroidota bacterium]
MSKELWINLPARDVSRSAAFFAEIGFTLNPGFSHSAHASSLLIGEKNIVLMLFSAESFPQFSQNKVSDTAQGTEVLFSFSADSREEIDELAQKVVAAGGTLFSKPTEVQGWMYGCAFTDPDGHRWNALYMDMSKMPG